jgi:carbon-monoxide dehydrogenase large subunit
VSTAKLPPQTEGGLEAVTRYSTPSITWANACHICTVEITDTSEVKLLRYIISEDCGVMINPMVVEGQISGGVGARYRCRDPRGLRVRRRGQSAHDDILDYLIPTTTDIPVLEIGHMETPASGPGGYKVSGRGRRDRCGPRGAQRHLRRASRRPGSPGITGPGSALRRARSAASLQV